jgi:hypothetical protein
MNKYEQLIEYIINDQEDKARELFHSIVVAKSRDIYESLMDETVDQYDQQGDLVDDVTRDENGGLGEADDEFGGEMDGDMGDDEFGGDDEGMDDMGGDEMGDEFGGDDLGDDLGGDDMGGEGDMSAKFQDIKSAIDDLEAEFASIMGGDEGVADDEMGDGEIEGGDEMAADDAGEDFGGAPEEVGAEEEEPMGESANPFAKSGSGKSGSGKASGSGKKASGSGKAASGSGKAGSGNPFAKKGSGSGAKTESRKSAAELMREYVEKISDGHGPEKHGEAEGNEVGSDRKSFPVNKTTPVAGKNDMGGTASNILSGKGNDTSDKDGQTSKAKAGGFMKAPVAIPGSERNVNKVGGNAGAQQFFKTKEKAKEAEGSTTKDSVPVSKDSLGYAKK